jgi:hypothetical protein
MQLETIFHGAPVAGARLGNSLSGSISRHLPSMSALALEQAAAKARAAGIGAL